MKTETENQVGSGFLVMGKQVIQENSPSVFEYMSIKLTPFFPPPNESEQFLTWWLHLQRGVGMENRS